MCLTKLTPVRLMWLLRFFVLSDILADYTKDGPTPEELGKLLVWPGRDNELQLEPGEGWGADFGKRGQP